MINIYECLSKYRLSVISVRYINNYVVVHCNDDNDYLLKLKDSCKKKVFNYLKNINYPFFLEQINNYDDSFELYNYYDDLIDDNYLKAKEIISAMYLLHTKTYSFSNSEDFNNLIEKYTLIVDKTMNYYLDLQDYIDELDFLSPQYYLLIINIYKIYNILRISKEKLNELSSKDSLSIRNVFLIGNVSCDNYRSGVVKYFIDWKHSNNSFIIFDFISFYKNDFCNLDMFSLFDIYNSKIKLSEDEINLLFSIICIPSILKFTKNNYTDTLMVRRLIDYVDNTLDFVLKEDKKYEKTNKNEFNE